MEEKDVESNGFMYRVPTTHEIGGMQGQAVDSKRPWTQYPMGYPRFAAFVANDSDRSTTIFRRFERLSARNLLYLETELSELEAAQDRLDATCKLDPNLESGMQSLEELNMLARVKGGPKGREPTPEQRFLQNLGHARVENDRKWYLGQAAQARLDISAKIRVVLKEYYKFLKLQRDILAMDSPDKRTLKGVRRVFKNVRNGVEHAPMIAGKMEAHLDQQHERDLAVLAPAAPQDRLTALLEGRFAFLFRTRTAEGVTEIISHKAVVTVVSLISFLVAAALLIGAIVGLSFVEGRDAQLILISCLTIAFAGSLGLLTNARRPEVYAATAAYAAVLVVFVSGNLGAGGAACSCSPI